MRAIGTALIVVAAVVFYLYFWWLGGLLSLVLLPWTLRQPRRPHAPPFHVPADLSAARPPRRNAWGDVLCTRCDRVVRFADMVVMPDGYFCPPCSRNATAAS